LLTLDAVRSAMWATRPVLVEVERFEQGSGWAIAARRSREASVVECRVKILGLRSEHVSWLVPGGEILDVAAKAVPLLPC